MNKLKSIACGIAAVAFGGAVVVGATANADHHEEMAAQSIAEIVTTNEDFSTLLAAVQAAGLAETLSGEGPYTVFAPTNAAFEALPEGALDGLLADTEALANVLLYHVVEGEVPASAVVELDAATMVQGGDVSISVTDAGVMLNGSATVVTTDVEASNGVIHVIDAVLLP